MLMELSENEVKPPSCGQDGEKLGATVEKRPEPRRVVFQHEAKIATAVSFVGWDHVFACIMEAGSIGVREGDAVILTPLHWAAQQWGRA